MSGGPTLSIKDYTKAFNDSVQALRKISVKVGIPAESNPRQDEEGGIGNAALLFINNFGSPANNIPARPVMQIGIDRVREEIAEEMRKAILGLAKGRDSMEKCFERAGIIASNSIKRVINDQIGIAPPSEGTLRARKYITQAGFKGTKSLLVTGQVRNAITYVVGNK